MSISNSSLSSMSNCKKYDLEVELSRSTMKDVFPLLEANN